MSWLVILIGLKGALQVNDILLLIISLTLGTLIGEMLKIEKGIEKTINWYKKNKLWLSYCEKKYKGNRLGNKWTIKELFCLED